MRRLEGENQYIDKDWRGAERSNRPIPLQNRAPLDWFFNSAVEILRYVELCPAQLFGTDQAGVTILSKLLTICVDIAIGIGVGIAIVIEIETK